MKLLRTVVVLILAVGLLAGMAPVSLAAPGLGSAHFGLAFHSSRDKAPWIRSEVALIRGTVEDVAKNGITVESAEGKVEIAVNDETRYHVPTLGWRAGLNGDLDDIKEGMRVAVLTFKEGDERIARQITVFPRMFLLRYYTGELVEYEVGENIIIKDDQGSKTTFEITASGKFKTIPPTATPEEGDRVTVIARYDSEDDGLEAIGVAVHSFWPRTVKGKSWQLRLRNLESVRGNIVDVDETNKTIAIDNGEEIVLDYSSNTVFALRGLASLEEAAEEEVPATLLYQAYDDPGDTAGEAKLVAVSIKLPLFSGIGIRAQ